MPWAMPLGAKLRWDEVSAVLLPGLATSITEDAPSSTQHMHFPNPLNGKILLQPLQLSPVTNLQFISLIKDF